MAEQTDGSELQETQATQQPTRLRDERTRPEGAVPKQAQGYVMAGLAVLILLAVLFSKNHGRTAAKNAALPSSATSTEVNQRKIAELERDLSADQRQSQQMQGQKAGTALSAGNPSASTSGMMPAAAGQAPPAEQPRDPVADAERELAFKSRFASNLVSFDDGHSRQSAMKSDNPEETAKAQPAPAEAVKAARKRAPEVSVNAAQGQPYVLFEGTIIDTALVNRLDGEFSGPVKVMVTSLVYSQDRQHVLIPEGTSILGDAQRVSGLGQKRLAIVFHRLIMPDGYSADLDQFHGLDQAGETGLKDKINHHYREIFGASIALGIISGASEATTNGGYSVSGGDMYRQGIASSLSQSSANVLDRFINIPPNLTIREGHRIKVYLTEDLLLPAYENHTVPGDI